ncbi:hypothetical protein LCGC14_2759180 [marine sediment metagenome]|uniref:Uncharacterized protein n=1 Tax=marine sediment metagenome TaxID=412755 RepID=A0A0F8YZF6_9ZZZZ
MTSEPSAEPKTSMPGLSDSLTAGKEPRTGTVTMYIGELGPYLDLGSLKLDLLPILVRSGMPVESIAVTAQDLILSVQASLLGSQELCISDMLILPTEPKKPENISTSES